MKEAYVSFEIAKLLKEKGFDEPITHCYLELDKGGYASIEMSDECHQDERYDSESSSWKFGTILLRPTQRMAMDWLMEEHDICIYCYPSNLPSYGKWESGACWIKDNVSVIFNNCSHSLYGDTYKETVEETLRYVLEHLI